MSDRKTWSSVDAEQANALASLIEAGNRGDGAAACRIGDIYREEVVGLDGSSGMAFHWYSRSALAGDPGGQNNLGACYEHGLGCAQSYPKAVKWYRLAAAQGLGTATMNLGYCYLWGHGIPADKAEALRLFRLAVERGENRAAKEVERLEGDRSLRVLQLVPTDKGQSADSVPQQTTLTDARKNDQPVDREVVKTERDQQRSAGKDGKSRIRYVHGTEAAKHFGLVGIAGVALPPAPWDDEEIRRELLEVMKCDGTDEAPSSGGTDKTPEATDAELIPIYAECGMTPEGERSGSGDET